MFIAHTPACHQCMPQEYQIDTLFTQLQVKNANTYYFFKSNMVF